MLPPVTRYVSDTGVRIYRIACQAFPDLVANVYLLLGAGVPTLVEADFAERRLGGWNLLPLERTQPWFDARLTPPGGESDDEFLIRVAHALRRLKPRLEERPLIVGSRGVGRVLGELVGLPRRMMVGNAELAEFQLAELQCLETEWGTL